MSGDEWQRLFTLNPPALPPAVVLANADSYTRFVKLIHDPAAPPASSQAAIAGIHDRLFKLQSALTGGGRTLKPGPVPSAWEPGPGANVSLSPQFSALSLRGMVQLLLVMIIEAAPFIEAGRRTAYIALIDDMSVWYGRP
jgi:hypothetical protein